MRIVTWMLREQERVTSDVGWGGMIGLGNASTNVNIGFSQRGNTTISGSANTGVSGIQGTFSTTTNGATSIGGNYNMGNGPRDGWNLGANYDINGGGMSGSVGYTDPITGLGLTSNINGNGLSTSVQVNGINMATNGPDGFNFDEMNWAEQNINLAQDRGNTLQENRQLKADGVANPESLSPAERNQRLADINRRNENAQLAADGTRSAEDIANMSPEAREAALNRINGNISINDIPGLILGGVGTVFGSALAFVGLGGSASGTTPTSNGRPIAQVLARKEDAVGGTKNDGESGTTDGKSNNGTDATNYPALPEKITVSSTEYSISDSQLRDVSKLKQTIENGSIKDPTNLKKLESLQNNVNDIQTRIDGNQNTIEGLISHATSMAEIFRTDGTSQKSMDAFYKENNNLIRKIAMENDQFYKDLTASKQTLAKETFLMKVQENSSLNTNFKVGDDMQRQAVYDLFNSSIQQRQIAAASYLYDNKVTFGRTEPLGTAQLVPREIHTNNDPNLLPGQGYTRIEKIGGYEVPMPGLPGVNPSSGFGNRIDPVTGKPNSGHGAIDIPTPEGTRIAIPYDGTVVKVTGEPENTLYQRSHGQAVTIQINGLDGTPSNYGYRIAHNSRIIVTEGAHVQAGQAVSLSGNSGRSTDPHTHVEIVKWNGKEWGSIVPSKQDLEEMKKLGIAK
ncbi:peptidoglycan DD-metalloendopeptidase family protein [Leptospira sp. 'Mane']|uniref:M23 family metallopeptidase n=1 Tax=Leptospira sp. 'Mane' TaxID=3387407 RepID=UPI00398B4C09